MTFTLKLIRMEKNKDDPQGEFYRLLNEEKRLIRQLGRTGLCTGKLKELSRIQARRAKIGKILNIGML